MANFERVNPPGWTNDISTITEGQLNTLDIDHTKTINATDGSTHAPSDPIEIGGAGILATGDLIADSTFESHDLADFTGSQSFDGALEQQPTATWALGGVNTLVSGGEFDLNSGSVQRVKAGSQVLVKAAGSITVEGSGQITYESGGSESFQSGSELTMQDGSFITVEGGAEINVESGAEVSIRLGASLLLEGQQTLNGSAAGIRLRIGTVADANASIGATKDVWLIPQTLTAPRVYTLDKTSRVPAEGETLIVRRLNCTDDSCIIQRESAVQLANITASTSGYASVRFIFRSGDWHFLEGAGDELGVASVAGTY